MSGDPLALLPHRGVALMLDEVVERAGDTITCRGRIRADSPFVRDGRAPAWVALELAAQAAAALESAGSPGDGDAGAPRRGFLVTVERVVLFCHEVPAAAALQARIARAGTALPLIRYHVAVEHDVRQVLAGRIALYASA